MTTKVVNILCVAVKKRAERNRAKSSEFVAVTRDGKSATLVNYESIIAVVLMRNQDNFTL